MVVLETDGILVHGYKELTVPAGAISFVERKTQADTQFCANPRSVLPVMILFNVASLVEALAGYLANYNIQIHRALMDLQAFVLGGALQQSRT